MADVKGDFDDDGDMKIMDVDGKIGMSSSGEDSSDEETEANEVMELPDTGLESLPDLWLVKVSLSFSTFQLQEKSRLTLGDRDLDRQVPKSLMEKWSKIQDPNVTLAKIRVHQSTEFVPSDPTYSRFC